MPSRTFLLQILPLYAFALAVSVSVSAGGIAAGLIILVAMVTLCFDTQSVRRVPVAVWICLGLYFYVHLIATTSAAPYPVNWHKWPEEMWLKLLLVAVPLLGYRYPKHIVRIVIVAVVIAQITALYAIWQHFSGYDPIRQRSILTEWGHYACTGFFNHHLSYGGQLLIYFLIVCAWGLEQNKRKQQLISLAMAGLFFMALTWSFARSPFVGVLASLVFVMIIIGGKRRLVTLAVVIVPTALMLVVPTIRMHLFRLLDLDGQATRLNLWQSSVNGILDHRWLGFGQGNFEHLMAGYEVEGFYNVKAHSHNDFLMHGVNSGILGMLAAVALTVVVFALLWRGWRQGIYGSWVLLAGLCVQVGISVAGLFQVYQTDDEVEMLLYFILGCGLALYAGRGSDAGAIAKDKTL